jgi:predicted metalloprotease with PDZ domain
MTLIDKNIDKNEPYLGAEIRGGGMKLTGIVRDSPAYNEGLNVNDEIIQIDGTKPDDLIKAIATKKIGDVVEVKVRRDGLEKKYNITLQRNPTKNYAIEPLPNQSKEQMELYKRWLFL